MGKGVCCKGASQDALTGASCFFIGHRDTGAEVFPALLEAVERHIREYGVTDFFVGNHGSFDRLAARAVREAKKRQTQVRLTLLLPYHPALRPVALPEGFDGSYYPFEEDRVPPRFAIVRANRRMVERCGFLIACVWHRLGGAGKIWDYAQRRAKRGTLQVTNLSQGQAQIR